MHDESPPGVRGATGSVPNLRDLGGWPVRGGGCVRRGQVFRSASLADIDQAGLRALTGLGVRTVFDLRSEDERAAQPDRVPPRADLVAVDVFGEGAKTAFGLPAEMQGALPADLSGLLSHPREALEALGGGRAAGMLVQVYRAIVTLPSARAAYGAMFAALADEERRPALFHCATGKDRAGWSAAALLMLLGVSDADVMTDYLLSNEQLVPAVQPLVDRFAAAGGDPDMLRQVLGARPEYLEAALEEMASSYGTIERYFEEGLGLDPERLFALRTALTDRDGAGTKAL